MRILVVEDARPLARSIAEGLSDEGFAVDVSHHGEEGLHLAGEIDYAAVVLDRMLPGLDGLAVLARLRAQGRRTPVLMLTALGQVQDRVDGLEGGADDYLVKPFAFEELLARLHALVRRSKGHARRDLALGRLRLDLSARLATVDGAPLDLSAMEYALLELLALERGRTFSRTEISTRLYAEERDPDSNVIDVFVARLRRKLEAAGLPAAELLLTVRGAGYRLAPASPGGA